VREKVPGALVEGAVGRRTAFEVAVDGECVHSKLRSMAFPDHAEVANIVADVAGGARPRPVARTTSDGACSLM